MVQGLPSLALRQIDCSARSSRMRDLQSGVLHQNDFMLTKEQRQVGGAGCMCMAEKRSVHATWTGREDVRG